MWIFSARALWLPYAGPVSIAVVYETAMGSTLSSFTATWHMPVLLWLRKQSLRPWPSPQALEAEATQFDTYEDYLDHQIQPLDLYYL